MRTARRSEVSIYTDDRKNDSEKSVVDSTTYQTGLDGRNNGESRGMVRGTLPPVLWCLSTEVFLFNAHSSVYLPQGSVWSGVARSCRGCTGVGHGLEGCLGQNTVYQGHLPTFCK